MEVNSMGSLFRDRHDAGDQLAILVDELNLKSPVVIGLPRGGIPVAKEVARQLVAPLDVIVVRKLGVPWSPELGFGAISEEGVVVYNEDVRSQIELSESDIQKIIAQETQILETRLASIRKIVKQYTLNSRTAVIVDDGIATGVDARAACRVAKIRGASRIVLATPVAPAGWQEKLEGEADDFVTVLNPSDMKAIGDWYLDFRTVTDEEVLGILGERRG